MLIPEVCYEFRSLVDVASTTLEQVIVSPAQTSAAAAQVIHTAYTVPSGKLLILSSMWGQCLAGAAQLPVQLRFQISRAGQTPIFEQRFYNAPGEYSNATLRAQILSWTGEMWLHPGWTLQVVGDFSAGGVANAVQGNLAGMLIPRGNSS
jgi:hypothetical protein